MNVLLAVNSKQLESYIESLKEVNVLKSLKNSKTLAADIISLKPHVVVIARYLPGELDIKELITNLNSRKGLSSRIVYLYGEEDLYRKKLNNFFIENNIFDFHVGDIDEDVINQLLFEPKKREDVTLEELSELEEEFFIGYEELENKEEILKSFVDDVKEKQLEIHFIEKIEEVERVVEVEKIVERIKVIEKEVIDNSVITLISNGPTGKSFLSWVLGHCLSERGYSSLFNTRGS